MGRLRTAPRTASGGRKHAHGGPLKRHVAAKGGRRPIVLSTTHRAIVAGGTLFPSRVFDPVDSPRLLIDGVNSRKIGKAVVKGRWSGMPILTLTLEERATCPTTCREWHSCYGNGMHLARRLRHGTALEHGLRRELAQHARRNPRGFVVRLHVLGDFYSAEYVRFWTVALLTWPQLRIFGFTAHPPESLAGRAITAMSRRGGDRCWIRFSGTEGSRGSVVVDHDLPSGSVLCPAQTGATDCCGTCGLCWTMPRTIAFRRH